jgi:hypothetical protein
MASPVILPMLSRRDIASNGLMETLPEHQERLEVVAYRPGNL